MTTVTSTTNTNSSSSPSCSSFTCSSQKDTQIKSLITAYYRQLTIGCGVDCRGKKCSSNKTDFEYESIRENLTALFDEAVSLARRAFKRDVNVSAYFFCENAGYPLHCFRLNVLTEESIKKVKTNEEMISLLQKGFGSDLDTLLFAFPFITKKEYEEEISLMSKSPEAPCLGLNLKSVRSSFEYISNVLTSNDEFTSILSIAINRLVAYMSGDPMTSTLTAQSKVGIPMCTAIPVKLGTGEVPQLTGVELASRALLILLQVPVLFDPTYGNSKLLHELCSAMQRCDNVHDILIARLSFLPKDAFFSLVVAVQQYISVQLYTNAVFINETIASATSVLRLLYMANYAHENASEGIIPFEEFYNGAVNDIIDVRKDFIQYVKTRNKPMNEKLTFSFARHPFMLDLNYKSLLLHYHSRVEQEREVQNTLQSLMASHWLNSTGGGVPSVSQDDFSFKLVVQRDDLLSSTLKELTCKTDRSAFKKPLRVQFSGEDGVDEGGVRKEFFQLLIKQIFDPSFGMFRVMEDSQVQWFVPDVSCPRGEHEFRLVGLLFGLAIYNSVILDVQFPGVVYKKLLGYEKYVNLTDLNGVDPSMADGLRTLLAYEENEANSKTIEEMYCRTFSVDEIDKEGTTVTVDLKENGRTIPLTIHNREEYVRLYVNYILGDSCAHNFNLFKYSFLEVCYNPVLNQIRPYELEMLVVGSPILDFGLLRNVCRYDGFKKTDDIIEFFWEVVLNEMTQEQQRKLLKFCTGSDRVPVGGLGNMTFVIGKNGGDSDLLPTAHTCFNHLLLPEYATKERMKDKLMMAINNCTGFGLM